MAKIISNSADFNQLAPASYSIWKIAAMGAGLGIAYFLIELIFKSFFVLSVADGLAIILTAVAGIAAMIWQKMIQPLIISLSVSASLWGLAVWSDGLAWFEVAFWCIFLFTIAYVLFSEIIHRTRLVFALIIILLIVIAARVVVVL